MCLAKREPKLYMRFSYCVDDGRTCRVSTLRSAMELKTVFEQIQAAEVAGNLSPEEKKRLEEQAAEKGLQALFKVRKLLIEFSLYSITIPSCRVRSWKSNPS